MRDAAPMIGVRIDGWVRSAILWLTLVLCCLVGLLTPYIVGVLGIALFIAVLIRGRLLDAYREISARLFLAAFVALGIAYAIYEFRLFGTAILCTAYVFDGLTDLMFGFEFHTMLYVALAAIVPGYAREPVFVHE